MFCILRLNGICMNNVLLESNHCIPGMNDSSMYYVWLNSNRCELQAIYMGLGTYMLSALQNMASTLSERN